MEFLSYTILFLISLVSTFLARNFFSKTQAKTCHHPPGPLALPVIGHMHLFGSSPHHALYNLAKRYGEIISIRLGSVPYIIVSSPEAAREFLRTHELAFASRPQSIATRYLGYGGHGFAFAPYGPYWKFMKKLCMSELLSGRSLGNFLPIKREEIQGFLQLLSIASADNKSVNIGEELKLMVGNVIWRMSMSRRCSGNEGEAKEIRMLVNDVSKLQMELNIADYIGFFRNIDLQGLGKRLEVTHQRFDEKMEEIVREHEEKKEKERGESVKDLMDILLEISEDESADMKLTREHIKAFIRVRLVYMVPYRVSYSSSMNQSLGGSHERWDSYSNSLVIPPVPSSVLVEALWASPWCMYIYAVHLLCQIILRPKKKNEADTKLKRTTPHEKVVIERLSLKTCRGHIRSFGPS